jgi:hypothetical protein
MDNHHLHRRHHLNCNFAAPFPESVMVMTGYWLYQRWLTTSCPLGQGMRPGVMLMAEYCPEMPDPSE